MRTMEWAARAEHLGGIPRKMVFMAVGAFAKAVANLFNTTTVYNIETLHHLVRSRPPGVPLLTVSNHMSLLDDPVMWGFKNFPTMDATLMRWVLAAEDICFKNLVLSYFFRLGKCIPITRGAGIYQEYMNEALDRLNDGSWFVGMEFLLAVIDACTKMIFMLHIFPEGKVCQQDAPIRQLKWGTASLIVRAPVTPIVLPIVHSGFEKVLPENYIFGRRSPIPLCNRDIRIVIGDPIIFDVPKLKQTAVDMSRDLSFSHLGWPKTTPCGLDEGAQRFLYTLISERIQTVMERLRNAGKAYLNTKN